MENKLEESLEKKKHFPDITIEEITNVTGFENVSDKDAIQIQHSLKELSTLIFFSLGGKTTKT